MWYVYFLRCSDDSIYTGMTNDLKKRVRAHNEGRGARYTRSRRPVELAGYWRFRSRSRAASREAGFKSLPRQEKLRALRGNTTRRTLFRP
jgi:putative endonuclease